MFGSTLEPHVKLLIDLLPQHHHGNRAAFRGYNLNHAYSMRFMSAEAAKVFVDHLRAADIQHQDAVTNCVIILRGCPMRPPLSA